MTLDEIDAAIAALPIEPQDDDALLARADLVRRRTEMIDATRNPHPQQKIAQFQPGNLVEVIVPPGGAGAVQSRTIMGKYYYAEVKDGHTVIMMPWDEFRAIAFAVHNSGSGPSGGAWLDANPHLVDRFPKNPAPPIAGPI
jgi:hypothetical protein